MKLSAGKLLHLFFRFLLRFLFSLLYKVRVYGWQNVPQTGPVLLLCNHQSFLDPPAVGMGARRLLCYVGRDSLFDNLLFGKLLHAVDALPIKRGTADLSAMKLIIEKLKMGKAVVMFPEATRTSDGRIADIKAGFGLVAKRSKATVVPVVIDGAFEVWPRTRKLPGLGRITLVYGKPMSPQHIEEIDSEQFAKEITDILKKMQSELRIRVGKNPF